jgi:hypothetical protein
MLHSNVSQTAVATLTALKTLGVSITVLWEAVSTMPYILTAQILKMLILNKQIF